jgi:hypothetical protein
MATLSDLGKKVNNTVSRQSSAFLRVEEWDATNSERDFSFVNLGRIMDASFNAEPVTSEQDQDGRSSTQLWDITVSFVMMQASPEEISVLDELSIPTDPNDNGLYPNGHTLYFSGSNQVTTSDMNSALTDDDLSGIGTNEALPDLAALSDPNGIIFENVLLNPGAEISLDSEVGTIPVEFTGRVALSELSDIETSQKITISPE